MNGLGADQSNRGKPVAVVGFAVSGEAVARHLLDRGLPVFAIDDHPGGRAVEQAESMGISLLQPSGPDAWEALMSSARLAVVSPGIPAAHPVFEACRTAGIPVTTEVEIAAREIQPPTRVVAVTGTNGKTTVVTLITEILRTAGRKVAAVGNIGRPMVEVIGEKDLDVIVVEVSSFQLALTDVFRPDVAVWLNVTEDHLDAHRSMQEYIGAKSRIFANQGPDDVSIVNAEDPAVLRAAASGRARRVSFGIAQGDFRVSGGWLTDSRGEEIVRIDRLPRRFPHDLANALAASAASVESGADLPACRRVLEGFTGLHHRIELITEMDGVRYYDDSKATTPAAVASALEGFDSAVLIAGGRNKGLSMGPMAARADRCRAVVVIGEAATEVAQAFGDVVPVRAASSMEQAIGVARSLARPGDAVLLSPGCASFDWYRSYAERGDHFARIVRELAASTALEIRGGAA